MSPALLLLLGAVMLLGLIGIVVPVMPGTLLVGGAIALWAVLENTAEAWITAVLAVGLLVIAGVVKYVVPGRRMSQAGVPRSTLVIGGLLGIVGFFVIPIAGLPIGFVGGIFLAEVRRQPDRATARRSTVTALKAVGLSLLIEMLAALLAIALWLGTVVWWT